MATVVIIGDECGLRIEACHRNQPNKGKLLHFMSTLIFLLNGYTQATRRSASVIKVGVDGVGICISIKKLA